MLFGQLSISYKYWLVQESRRRVPSSIIPPPLTKQQRESIAHPLRIALMTAHYYGLGYARQISNCTLHGQPLNCTYFQSGTEPDFSDTRSHEAISADAVWWHAPNTCLLPVETLQQTCSHMFDMHVGVESKSLDQCMRINQL